MLGSISKLFCAVILYKCFGNEAAKILAVIPTPSISHQVVFRPLFHELAKRGHDVTIVTTDPAFEKGKTPQNITEIDLHDISYELWTKIFLEKVTGKKEDLLDQISTSLEVFNMLMEKQVKSEGFQDILKKPKNYYDLIFIEACFRPYLALSHIFEAPIILVSSLGPVFDSNNVIGVPDHPTLNPTQIRQKLYNLTFWEKFHELYNHYHIKIKFYNHIEPENAMIRKLFGPNVPSIYELYNNVDMLFLNTNPIIEGNQPVPTSVVQLFGIHRKPEKELPNDFKRFMENSEHGVIYMSFGTNTDPSLLPREKIQIFVNVFTKLPYNILWKWNRDDVPSNATNIRFGKWFPQSDILRHPKIKLFITQGGLQSTEESINAAVPLLGIPMLGDQWYNTEKYKHFKIGEKLDIDTLYEDILRGTIDKVIGDKSYRQNIDKFRVLLADQPDTPLQRGVWWTEYVIRHKGAKHLKSPYANISWWDYLEIEFVLKLLALVSSAAVVCSVILYYLFCYVYSSYMRNNKLKKIYFFFYYLYTTVDSSMGVRLLGVHEDAASIPEPDPLDF